MFITYLHGPRYISLVLLTGLFLSNMVIKFVDLPDDCLVACLLLMSIKEVVCTRMVSPIFFLFFYHSFLIHDGGFVFCRHASDCYISPAWTASGLLFSAATPYQVSIMSSQTYYAIRTIFSSLWPSMPAHCTINVPTLFIKASAPLY